jgi:hypothetical protein
VDSLMNQLWQAGLSPFDGDCLITEEMISVEDLRALLAVLLPELKSGLATDTLYTFDDWHQHDGYITDRRVIDWSFLDSLSRSTDALIASRQGDSYVNRSFYPEKLSFLVRIDIPNEDCGNGTGFFGRFDLSAKPLKIARILSLVPLPLRSHLRVESSKGYFDRTYAG